MRRTSFEEMNCSVAQTLEVVGDWWTMLIVRDCVLGVTRFEAFSERLGIARNILTDRLEHLVEHGVLTRVSYQDRPARYDYRLTDKGRDLWLVLNAMRQWVIAGRRPNSERTPDDRSGEHRPFPGRLG
jgi:DNA-binding HxlR family transcriptional regulator